MRGRRGRGGEISRAELNRLAEREGREDGIQVRGGGGLVARERQRGVVELAEVDACRVAGRHDLVDGSAGGRRDRDGVEKEFLVAREKCKFAELRHYSRVLCLLVAMVLEGAPGKITYFRDC